MSIMNSFFAGKTVEYKGYKIAMWCDSVLTSMPPIPVYKAQTDRDPIITIQDTDPAAFGVAMRFAIDKVIYDSSKEKSDV